MRARGGGSVRPVSAAAGATSGPSAATIASMLGRGPAFMRVEPAPHRRHMGRLVAATAADDARAAIDREPGIGLHQLRRAGIVDFGAVPLRHAGVGLGDQRGVRIGGAHGEDRDEQIGRADAAVRAIGERLRIETLDERAERGRRDPHHRPAGGVEARGDRVRHADLRRGARRRANFLGGGHGLDPDDVRAALPQALDLLDEHVDRLVLAERPERGEDVAGRTDRSGDDDAPARRVGDRAGVLGGEPVELPRARLEPVQREAPAIAAKTVGQDDVRAGVDEGLMQGLDPVGMGGVPQAPGVSPEARPIANRLVPVAPSASSGRPSASKVCSMSRSREASTRGTRGLD